jgi:hypothetical protein
MARFFINGHAFELRGALDELKSQKSKLKSFLFRQLTNRLVFDFLIRLMPAGRPLIAF